MDIKDIEKIRFDVTWHIEGVQIPCVGKVKVYFDTEDMHDQKTCVSLPPSKKQIETLLFAGGLPKNFIKKHAEMARNYCRHTMATPGCNDNTKIDYEKIHKHYQITSLIIPATNSTRACKFIFAGRCDWKKPHGIHFLLKGEKVVGCGSSDLEF